METITLSFGTKGCVEFSVSSIQNNYDRKNFLPIVMEEEGPSSYRIYINCDETIESVFPIFKVNKTSFFKFQHNNISSPCIKVDKGHISSFISNNVVYGLEILNESKQKKFEASGGHKHKELKVWFGIEDEGQDECGPFRIMRHTETDGCCSPQKDVETDGCCSPQKDVETDSIDFGKAKKKATIALNNSSSEVYKQSYFEEPEIMNERTFHFLFQTKPKMMGNLYL